MRLDPLRTSAMTDIAFPPAILISSTACSPLPRPGHSSPPRELPHGRKVGDCFSDTARFSFTANLSLQFHVPNDEGNVS